jgi:hypothetical protein
VDQLVILGEVFLTMNWPPDPAFAVKIHRELFGDLPPTPETLLAVLEWIEKNQRDTRNGEEMLPSPEERIG